MTTSVGARVLAEVYRLHHVPLPAITLQELLKRGARATPAIIEKLQQDPSGLQQWKEANAPLIITSAQLLHREVPIRLARRIVDLENLPDELPDAPSIVKLRNKLLASFDELISFPLPRSLETEQKFMDIHRRLRSDHATMHAEVSDAIKQLNYEPQGLSESLDNFYNSRIGIRTLVDQHLAAQAPVPGFTGIVSDTCSPVKIAKDVLEKVTPGWEVSLNGHKLPEFQITGDETATYRYIPQHIELILSEVIKNAVFNSVNASSSAPPPVSILVSGGSHGVCIKVSDVGGGMTRKQANALFSYRQAASSSSSIYDPVSAALEKRARGIDFLDSFGLRIASLHAKYFGGDLSLMPMEGHGVDAYIYMNCLTGASEV
uniref:Protein-serine/threonine kinase n=1 Tax=Globisporangium ultimum (strain ATCC 200006 / CBS 805.95 / DAOM BR144) TaxID=431595 RepID=K3WU04_GLOUD